MKKKLIPVCALALILAAALLICNSTFYFIGGSFVRRDTTHLTLTGTLKADPGDYARLSRLTFLDLRNLSLTQEQYDAFRSALPDCEILWSVPFQGNFYASDTTSLTIASLSTEDLSALEQFPQLTDIHAEHCRDYDSLMALQSSRPDLNVTYSVLIGGTEYHQDTSRLTLADADVSQLEALLQYLPEMEYVKLEGTLPEASRLLHLVETYPEIQFYWQIEVCGITVDSQATELDLSGIPMESVAEVEAAVAYLPALEKVLMMDCGIPDEEMGALNERHEAPLFVWNVQIGPILLRTDASVFAPVKHGLNLWDGDLENLKYCTELVVLDLGHMRLWEIDFLSGLTKLEYLIIADTHVQDISPLRNMKNLKFLEMFLTSVRDYSPLLELTALEDLNICFTYGDPTPLLEMTWLKRLWCGGCHINNEQFSQLRSTLSGTEIAAPVSGSTDQGWRQGEHYFIMRDLLEMPYLP